MIPNSAKWNQSPDIQEYITIPVTPPPIPNGSVSNICLGPFAIGDSRGRLDARYWLVKQVNGKVVLQFSKR